MTNPEEPFIVQRRRLGRIRHVDANKKYGFIEAEDYREDVFFHLSVWESQGPSDRAPYEGQFIEFEIDEPFRRAENRLRALAVRATKRPDGTRLSTSQDPHLAVKHHPKARKSKPSWRQKP